MTAMGRRIAALERGAVDMSPAVKLWLGWPVSEADRTSITAPCDIDTTKLTTEEREWLGLN